MTVEFWLVTAWQTLLLVPLPEIAGLQLGANSVGCAIACPLRATLHSMGTPAPKPANKRQGYTLQCRLVRAAPAPPAQPSVQHTDGCFDLS